ncbi:MAG: hypothetical protein AW09_003213 [Candidatus Accumulibacter phosphatis]|uniref:Uncharacterized protein n=1 Tax=Candidatus Accumulibacter phosphatis TaxID=327160 RepID=A0A080LT29_9PROT|nr:MAG: hypothetical protein AW09_003213 [Candidatus Accumulibacter phosphatis]
MRQREELGGHDAAGAVRVVLQQTFDFRLAVAAKHGHQFGALILRQFADEVSEVIGLHMFQQRRQFLDRRFGHYLRAQVRPHLAEDFGTQFLVADRVEDIDDMLGRQFIENRCHVSGVDARDHFLQRAPGVAVIEAINGFDEPFFPRVVGVQGSRLGFHVDVHGDSPQSQYA